jgi:hypothetical protein
MMSGFTQIILPMLAMFLLPLIVLAFAAPPVFWVLGLWTRWWLS